MAVSSVNNQSKKNSNIVKCYSFNSTFRNIGSYFKEIPVQDYGIKIVETSKADRNVCTLYRNF